MPVVVGAPRSGTTLLRFMLDAHRDVAIPPESGFLVPCAELAARGAVSCEEFHRTVTGYPADAPGWADFQIDAGLFLAALGTLEPFTVTEGVRLFYRMYASRFGKPRWGDKTPLYCLHLPSIEAILPEAHFLHIIRDGRDVALSQRPLWFAPGRDIETLAAHWRQCVTTCRNDAVRCSHYMEVRYKQLVEDPPGVLGKICRFLDLDFDDRMLRYYEFSPERLREHQARIRPDGIVAVSREQRLQQQYRTTQPPDPSRVSVWKHEMSAAEQRRFDAVAGDLLRELGFE